MSIVPERSDARPLTTTSRQELSWHQPFYDRALDRASIDQRIGIRIITPEDMVILKYLAGRGKDQIDLMWLLREDGMVDRTIVKRIVDGVMGKHSYWAQRDLEQLFLEADLLKARDGIGK